MIVTSVCSSKECTHKTVLYGSTTAVCPSCKTELGLLAVVHRQTFQHQATK